MTDTTEPRRGKLPLEFTPNLLGKEYREVCEAMQRIPQSKNVFDPTRYDPRAIESCRSMWHQRMEFEHRSTVVFSNLVHQLFEANASLDAKVVMLRMAQDEVRHTETCANVVRALGGDPTMEIPLDFAPLAQHKGCTPEERALRNVIYTTCLSEMIAVARFVETLEHTTDPYMRDANRALLSDEKMHGQFGFLYLEAWQPWLEAHPEARAGLTRYLRHSLVVLEQALAGPDVHYPELTADELALGVVDPNSGRDVFYSTIEGAVLPGLDRFGLEASKAWRERRLEPGAPAPPPVR